MRSLFATTFLLLCCISISLSKGIEGISKMVRSWKLNRHCIHHLTAGLVAASMSPLMINVSPALAVSGGGKDYATKDIRNEDFSGQNLMGKDFTQCDASNAIFRNAKLSGSRFYRANLKEADFTKADLQSASLEDTSLADVLFTDANLSGAYFSASIEEAKSLKGADFTDALMPDFTKRKLCARADVKDESSVNPVTGISTAESLMCL
mmetsp:Transcript_21301/g.29304  ORF Transcript_21301/g.29304 Transcript_21301/m.29304 type:complete len:208 (+) Transcript_21301:8-631(+)